MRIALCQINPTVGDLHGNAAQIAATAQQVSLQGAALAVFPELALCGYPPRDLVERRDFVAANRHVLEQLAKTLPKELTALVGFVDRNPTDSGRPACNALAVLGAGEVMTVLHKQLLPSYDIFDEHRYFEPGNTALAIDVQGYRLGLTICEDAWNDVMRSEAPRRYAVNPVQQLIERGVDALVNVAASPFSLRKHHHRRLMWSQLARQHGKPLIFVNQAGANDDLLFDGCSAAFAADGQIVLQLAAFETDVALVEVSELLATTTTKRTIVAPSALGDADLLLDGLTVGVRDYARKCGFGGAVLGLSGGIDSAVVAAIAVKALGSSQVLGVAMPTRYSSAASVEDAKALADNLGMRLEVVDIDAIFQQHLDVLEGRVDALAAAGANDVTWENLQSRIRCATLMAFSNRLAWLPLATGNKSELAVGYCTLYGDMGGGLAVLSDVWKTRVYDLARAFNDRSKAPLIPTRILSKPPSAELRWEQTDQDSLPPYERLDAILRLYVEAGQSIEEIVTAGFDVAEIIKLLKLHDRSEFKRRQLPPGLIVSDKAFGPGRRRPIAAFLTGTGELSRRGD